MKQERQYRLKAFFIALLMAVVIILPVVIYSGGYLVFYGDYNAQQIPFYKACMRAVQQGYFGWNWETNIGENFIGSYSFYTLGSPFFWLVSLFPVSISQYFMAPLLALKMALSSLFAYIYLRRFTKSGDSALVGALVYAFSGFSLLNSVFFHFHEAICFFPLLLTALEEAVMNKRRGVFALCVALCALVNYFFFIGECVFLVLYFIARALCDKDFRIGIKDFLCLAFESVAGVMIAGILFVPSIAQVLSGSRTGNLINGTDMFVYSEPETYLVILKSLFLPPEPFSKPMLFNSNETGWRSVSLYLPLFSVAGIVAFMRNSEKRSWIKSLIAAFAVFALVPVLNSAFTMFNSEYYARWYFMATLILALATAKALEEESADWRAGCAASLGGAVLFTVIYLFEPFGSVQENVTYDIAKPTSYYNRIMLGWVKWEELILFAIAVLSAVLLAVLFARRKKQTRAKFMENVLGMLVVVSIVTGAVHFFEARLAGPVYKLYNKAMESSVQIDDDEFFRISSDEVMNYNMCWGYPSPQSFHSIIPSSINDLHTAIDSVNKSIIVVRQSSDLAFDALTRVKYIAKPAVFEVGAPAEYYDETQFYKFVEKQDVVNIYRNDLVMPMACSYDVCCSVLDVKNANGSEGGANVSTNLMVHSVALDDATYAKYADILEKEVLSESELNLDRLKSDIADRQALGADSFEITKKGFEVKTSYDTDRILVISTAYDKGWSAEINGVPAEVDRANVGFLAIRVPAGENEVVFTYTAPGLILGIIFTIVGTAALILYCAVIYLVLKKRPERTVYPAQDRGVTLHSDYISQLTDKDMENR